MSKAQSRQSWDPFITRCKGNLLNSFNLLTARYAVRRDRVLPMLMPNSGSRLVTVQSCTELLTMLEPRSKPVQISWFCSPICPVQ